MSSNNIASGHRERLHEKFLNRGWAAAAITNIIQDDVENLTRIGLNILRNGQDQFRIADNIVDLRIPALPVPQLVPSHISQTKLRLSSQIQFVAHSFFELIDLGFDSRQSRLYELRIVDLLNLVNNCKALHLSGGNRPEIIIYSPVTNPRNGAIMDAKSYSAGFNIPNAERDKMIRYINECNKKDPALNSNRWWENLMAPTYPQNPIKYGFVSGNFTGQFLGQLQYILVQTGISGGAITSETLIEKVEKTLNPNISYTVDELFNDLGCNGLV